MMNESDGRKNDRRESERMSEEVKRVAREMIALLKVSKREIEGIDRVLYEEVMGFNRRDEMIERRDRCEIVRVAGMIMYDIFYEEFEEYLNDEEFRVRV